MAEEIIIYENKDIKITNLRAVFSEKTYSIANITSVESQTIPPNTTLAMVLFVIGLMLFILGIADYQSKASFIIYSLFAFGLFFILKRSATESYSVNLTTAAGEVKAYISDNQETTKHIVDALNNAIIKKG